MGNKVSVIMLTYNSDSQGIINALRSLLAQTYKDLELIIHDDGSKFFDQQTISDFLVEQKAAMPYQIVHNPENVGTVRNFNRAWRKATGEYIVVLPGDDCFAEPESIAHIVDCFEKTGCDICYGRRRGKTSGRIEPDQRTIQQFLSYSSEDRAARIFYTNIFCGATLSYRRSLLEECGGFDEQYRLLEDYPFMIRAVLEQRKIEFLNEPTIVYGENGVSASGKVNPILKADFDRNYQNSILPRLDLVKSRILRRYLQYRFFSKHTDQCRTLVYIRFADVLIFKLKNRLAHIIFRKKQDEFEQLIRNDS